MTTSPIVCPQCHSPQHRHLRGNTYRCEHCGSEFWLNGNTPTSTATPPISSTEPSATANTPPRARLKELLITLAILLAAALLLEIMWAA